MKSIVNRNLRNFNNLIIIFTIILLITVTTTLIFVHIKNQDAKNELRKEITQSLNQISGNGQVVYDEIQDKGCETVSRGLGSSHKVCHYIGNKLFKNTGQVETDILKLHNEIANQGYKLSYPADEGRPRLPEGNDAYSAWLYLASGKPNISIVLYVPLADTEGNGAYRKLGIPQLPIDKREYLYGVEAIGYYK